MGTVRISTPEVGQCSGILIGPQRRDTETLARLWGPILKTKHNPRSMSALLSMGHQAAHSSNRRIISMSLHPIRMTEPHNMKGTP